MLRWRSVVAVVDGIDAGRNKIDMSFRDIPETLTDGTKVKMGDFAGNVLYITNVASA
jgi:hypothetical protein